METKVEWHDARSLRRRKQAVGRGESVFAGGFLVETCAVDSVRVIRLNAWPKGASRPPYSYAVFDQSGTKADEEHFPALEIDEGLYSDDQVGQERRGAGDSSEVDSAENGVYPENEGEQASWRPVETAEFDLPLKFEWQQSSESRWDMFFEIPAGAQCFGLGERMSGLNLRSAVHTLFNTDNNLHLESIDSMYKSIPFLMIRHHGQCYGLFLDSPARQKWDLDSGLEERGHIELLSRRGWQLYFFGPASLPDIVSAYTALTGRAQLPPLWSLGHHQSRWSYPDQETVIRVAHEFRSRGIPCDVLVLDIDYMDDYRVFTCSNERFPDFRDLVSDLSNNNFKVVTIVDPGVKKDSKFFIYDDGKKHGVFCTKSDGKPFVGDVWPGPSVFPDFAREDVRLWWAAQHGFHVDYGVAGIWNDMNEPAIFNQQIPLPQEATELPADDAQLFLQEVPEGKVGHFEVRNLYGYQMSRATYEGLLALRPSERPFVLSRAAYAGIQRYAAVWLGDNMSWWEHLACSIPMLVNMSLSGVAFCGVDIGGFGHDCSAELLLRWYSLGIFYPFFRNHCSMHGEPQEPWSFNSEVEEHCRKLIETRYRLLPYIQQMFVQQVRTGAPLMRPLIWHYPDDEFAGQIDDQFLFGQDILVAPILQRGCTMRSVYLPEGNWHKFDGELVLEGERLHKVSFELGEVPAFVREGAVLPLADPVQSTAELAQSPINFVCYGDSGKCIYYEDDGTTLAYKEGNYNEWRIRIDGRFLAQPVELGFDAPEREYRMTYKGTTSSVKLCL